MNCVRRAHVKEREREKNLQSNARRREKKDFFFLTTKERRNIWDASTWQEEICVISVQREIFVFLLTISIEKTKEKSVEYFLFPDEYFRTHIHTKKEQSVYSKIIYTRIEQQSDIKLDLRFLLGWFLISWCRWRRTFIITIAATAATTAWWAARWWWWWTAGTWIWWITIIVIFFRFFLFIKFNSL